MSVYAGFVCKNARIMNSIFNLLQILHYLTDPSGMQTNYMHKNA